ncbi:MAG: hypothetical protein ACE5HA_09715 [Anaerolineae bacterium]
MKSRNILLAILMFAIILGTGLVGLSYEHNRSSEVAALPASAIVGEEVGRSRIRLFADPRKSTLLYEIDGARVYRGTRSRGRSILYFDGRRIFRGANRTGDILYTVSGNRIYAGPNTTGRLVYTISRGRVFRGHTNGSILYTIRGDRLFRGPNTRGRIVFEANRNLTGSVQFLLPILAEQNF